MTRIILAAHGGPSAEGAARLAPLLARRLGAELDAITVLEPLPPTDFGFGVIYAGTPQQEADVGEALRAEATAQLVRCGADGCVPALHRGPAATEIAGAARAARADLIVVGLGPHDVVDRALGEETALQLVQMASTPVLAVPTDASALPHTAVAAIDFTPTSLLAARTAARMLVDGDTLHLVHVRTRAALRAAREGAEGDAAPEEPAARLADVGGTLGAAPGVRIQTAVVDGEPARALLDYLERANGDIIALGSHGYGLWKRLTLGSVASKIVRLTTRTVLVAPLGSLAAVEPQPPA
ncbi:MAG TPA: universal stress protein [Gemmatimonadaceae bacterium]|nr:universal stress protein [Gemmatimonadaceae bacterium]